MTRRVVHLSDLHFGRDRPELLAALIDAIRSHAPDLVAISGDLTQRARPGQFRAARRFIDRLDAPVLVVPGNHDVPLDNLAIRWLRPFARYRRHIFPELEPSFTDAEMTVLGVNTVNPFSWQRGKFRDRAVARVCTALADAGGGTRIAVLHHPLEQEATEAKALMRGASRSVARLAACGTDIVLSGHLHSWRAVAFTAQLSGHGCLLVQAGTGLSTRDRGEANDFNLLEIETDRVEITHYAAGHGSNRFGAVGTVGFDRAAHAWHRRDPQATGDRAHE